ncbi:MAG: prealbumin-like fold domain-containing protein [Treponema sp.]|nr:prealbumin-like fold domain-containing protein [Treponema sp.]
MKRTLFGLVTVLLALGLVLSGCAGPFDTSSASASRNVAGPAGFDTGATYVGVFPRGENVDGMTVEWNLSEEAVSYGTASAAYYPVNPYFEDFYVAGSDGSLYSSFCADWNSGFLGPEIEDISKIRFENNEQARANIVSAFGYIYDTWGSLDQWAIGNNTEDPADATKNIAQLVLWPLLDDGVLWTKVISPGYEWINAYAEEVLAAVEAGYKSANYQIDLYYLGKGDYTVNHAGFLTYQSQLVPIVSLIPQGFFKMNKTANGVNIAAYYADKGGIPSGITFVLYKDGKEFARQALAADGVIDFTGLPSGSYVLKEILSSPASGIFEQAPDMPFEINFEEGIWGGVSGFDFDALYTIVNGYGKGGFRISTLGYPGLNNNGDIFYIGVTNSETGDEYASFCANVGSKNFAGDAGQGCAGYYTAVSVNDVRFFSAFNFINDMYGDLNENRIITQTVIWALLDGIDVNSPEFEATALTQAEKDAVLATLAAANGKPLYTGSRTVVGAIYMVCTDGHDFVTCQPQIVPLYSGVFNNILKPPVTGSYGSVTATNAGNVPAILAGLNPKNGNALFDKKNPEDPAKSTPFVVPNANHFTFAKFARAELEAGVALDLVVGNKFDIVGKAFVVLVDGNIVITIDDFANGAFGAIAFNQLPVTNNGNIHSQKEKDLAAFGAKTGFNHDNKVVVPCPSGNSIYLYIHFDNVQFYL